MERGTAVTENIFDNSDGKTVQRQRRKAKGAKSSKMICQPAAGITALNSGRVLLFSKWVSSLFILCQMGESEDFMQINEQKLFLKEEPMQDCVLCYNLVENELLIEDHARVRSFGIAISLKDREECKLLDFSEIRDISVNQERIAMLFQKLVNHSVTPVQLPDIVSDFLAEY